MPLHIICEGLGIRTGTDGRLRSGDWNMSMKNGRKMVGHVLHLHRSKKAASHQAYTIVDVEQSNHQNRVVFILGDGQGTRPAPEKWNRTDWCFQEVDPYTAYVEEARSPIRK
jgi:hypothetical protein